MNTNNNVYTIVYTTVIVVVVAAILAFVSQGLKDKQEANEKADTISQMLKADGLSTRDELQALGNAKVLDMYSEQIEKVLLVNTAGVMSENTLSTERASLEVFSPSQLKAIWKAAKPALKQGNTPEIDGLPVFIFKNGYTVIPVYGDGLWGPIWGYISLDKDLKTIRGAYFDHDSETAGLGAQIKDNADFQKTFEGRIVSWDEDKPFAIVKGGVSTLPPGTPTDNKIDAIAGATMTSNGLQDAINAWLGFYKAYLSGNTAGCEEHDCSKAEGESEHQCDKSEGEEHNCGGCGHHNDNTEEE